jgi:hypothetical protein
VQKRIVAQGQRPGEIQVMLRASDCHGRQNEHFFRNFLIQFPAKIFRDHPVGPYWQMWSVLFYGSNGQDNRNVSFQRM